MKKRINVQFLIVVSIAIIVTAAAAICIFYNTFKREIMENLKTTAYTIKNISGQEYGIQEFDYDKLAQTRITVVRSDGTVVLIMLRMHHLWRTMETDLRLRRLSVPEKAAP